MVLCHRTVRESHVDIRNDRPAHQLLSSLLWSMHLLPGSSCTADNHHTPHTRNTQTHKQLRGLAVPCYAMRNTSASHLALASSSQWHSGGKHARLGLQYHQRRQTRAPWLAIPPDRSVHLHLPAPALPQCHGSETVIAHTTATRNAPTTMPHAPVTRKHRMQQKLHGTVTRKHRM
jgi:hypothetical protein